MDRIRRCLLTVAALVVASLASCKSEVFYGPPVPRQLGRPSSSQRGASELNANGLFLLTNVEIERDAVISAFELYADIPGKIAIDFLRFKDCPRRCGKFVADFYRVLNITSETVDFYNSGMPVDVYPGYNYIQLKIPIFIANSSLAFVSQVGAGDTTILAMNASSKGASTGDAAISSDFYIDAQSDHSSSRLLALNPAANWYFYLRAIASHFVAQDKPRSYGHQHIPNMILNSYEYLGQEDADEYFLPSFEFAQDSVITGFEIYSLTTSNSFRIVDFRSCANRTANETCIEHLRSHRYFYTDEIVRYDFINLELAQVGYNKVHLAQPVFVRRGNMIQFSRRGPMSNTHIAIDPNGRPELGQLDYKYRCKSKRGAKFPAEMPRSRCRLEKLQSMSNWRFFLRVFVKELVPASERVLVRDQAPALAPNLPRLESSTAQQAVQAPNETSIFSSIGSFFAYFIKLIVGWFKRS